MLPKQSVVGLYLAAVFVLLICVSSDSLGQAPSPVPPKVMAPHRPIAPRVVKPKSLAATATLRSMVGGLWMTDANFKSAIYIRNIVETDPITVTPILHLSNGVKYTLPNITVQPAGIAVIDINQGLQQQGIASYSTLSGYAELQYTWPWDPFCVTIRNVDLAHSLIFTYGLQPTMPPPIQLVTPLSKTPRQTIEGMWWKHEANVTAFVALANISSQPVQAIVQVTDNLANVISQHNVTVSPQGMKLVNLDELLSSTSVQGGILITSSATTDNLIVNGALEDQAVGYSADLSFATDAVSSSGPMPETIAELGLMAGAADPMMSFPAGTTFTPYSELRNVSDTPLSVTPTLWWMAAGSAQSAQLPIVSIQSHQTLGLDVMSLLAQAGLVSAAKTFNGSFNLVFAANINTGALLLAAGSVDQTNTYVFEVIPHGIAEGGSKSLQYWSTGNGDDTMVNMWNPADEAQDFVVTLFFGLPDGTQGHYLWPLHLEARAARTFNVSQIIQNQIPDSEGNIIPAVVHEGGIKIAGSQAENEHILLAVDSGIYNVRKATCGPGCQVCNGYTGANLFTNPSVVSVQRTNQLYLVGTWGTGGQYNLPGSWYSYQPSIAAVGVSSGMASGVSPGSTSVYASSPNQPVEVTPFCGGGGCPTTAFYAQAPVNVFSVTSVTPSPLVVGTNGPMTIGGTGFSNLPSPLTVTFSSTGITVRNPTVVSGSDTLITATYTVASNAPLGQQNLYLNSGGADGGQGASSPAFPVTVQAPTPIITGASSVWWFNGQNPDSADYPISVTLTSSAGAATSWSVNQADQKVNLSPAGARATITATGSHFSGQVGDISVTATANGISSSPFSMTVRTPWKLVSRGNPKTTCFSSPQTYSTTISYDVHDNLDTSISSDIFWNETLGTAQCENGSNWCNGSLSISGGGDSNPLNDLLAPPDLNATPSPTPIPTCSGNNSGTVRYRSITQIINVGSSNGGSGVPAQSDTLG